MRRSQVGRAGRGEGKNESRAVATVTGVHESYQSTLLHDHASDESHEP